jgi:phage/plasmid-associated DNA primase
MTNRFSRGLGAGAVTALLTVGLATGVASVATAGDGGTASTPCATQQAQVDRATAKLADLQVVFTHEKRDLRKAQRALAQADTAKEKRHATVKVAHAKADVADAATTKKAQVQRLARAQARLVTCQAGVPTDTPTDPSTSPAA